MGEHGCIAVRAYSMGGLAVDDNSSSSRGTHPCHNPCDMPQSHVNGMSQSLRQVGHVDVNVVVPWLCPQVGDVDVEDVSTNFFKDEITVITTIHHDSS